MLEVEFWNGAKFAGSKRHEPARTTSFVALSRAPSANHGQGLKGLRGRGEYLEAEKYFESLQACHVMSRRMLMPYPPSIYLRPSS